MRFKKTKAAALSLAAVLSLGAISGCSLVTTDSVKDLEQVVAEVDISKSEPFADGKEFAAYRDSIEKTQILKRDLVANFATIGSAYVNSYGYSVQDTYTLIKNSLVNRSIFLQYAQVYFFESGEYSLNGYNAAKAAAQAEAEKKWGEIYGNNASVKDFLVEYDTQIGGLSYFLDENEIATAEYNVKVSFNATLDAQEEEVIAGNHTHEHDHEDESTTTARTTPTGVDATNEDYFDPAYQIYTGINPASECGSYETIEKSTPSTRKSAYKSFLASLNTFNLISKGENTGDITTLTYYAIERKTEYENTLVTKLTEAFEDEIEAEITEKWIREEKLEPTVASQRAQFDASSSAVDSALGSVSDSNYVFYAPDDYGFVINILLPFSTLQTQEYNDSHADLGDVKGNKFQTRATLLQKLTATDQRTSWFTDANYEFEKEDAYTGGDANRKYVFFENNLTKSNASGDSEEAQYTPIKNYLGNYTYNGIVEKKETEDGEYEYAFQPNKLTIDGFLAEMKSYLKNNGVQEFEVVDESYPNGEGEAYYGRSWEEYYKFEDGNRVEDYSKFLYYKGKIAGFDDFDVNEIFHAGSKENNAMSIINELSFAYNTDTGGLNSYLGYAVSPNSTNFMKEFEYAAQEAVKGGAGTITVAPTDYGWHIMYCTFSYAGNRTPYVFDWNDIKVEGTFSNLYYEALKASNLESYSQNLRTTLITSLDSGECVSTYEDRYKDLWEE